MPRTSRYSDIIESIFKEKFSPGMKRLRFDRTEFNITADSLGLDRVSNLGDIVYKYRYRSALPNFILKAAPSGYEWIIIGTGIAAYEFRLAVAGKITATSFRKKIKIPDATPEIVKLYVPGIDEQALLTKVRYNKLVDIFLGLTCYSLQNHYRTVVPFMGQIEVDEIYIGVSKNGAHYILPCQAKSANNSFGVAQTYQDMMLCAYIHPNTKCRPIGIQFASDNSIALLELEVIEVDEIFTMQVVDERHYILVPRNEIQSEDLTSYLMSDNV